MTSTNGVPWITHRIQHPTANDIIVRDTGLPIPVAIAEVVEPYAIAFHGAASDHRRQASIVDSLLTLLLRQHLYRFILPVGRAYRLPETQTDWIDVRRKLAASVAMTRIVSAVRSTDLVVSSSWDDEYGTVPTPHSHAVLHKIVSIFGEEVASSGSAETRAEVLQRIAVEVEARFGCRFLLPRRCNSNSTIVYRVLDPQCEQAQHLLSQSFADWPAAVAEQLDDTLLMLDNTTRAFLTAQDIQTTDALLQTSTEDLVRDLLGWRRQQDMKEWKNSTAKIYVNRWKRMAAKHQRNMDGGTDLDTFPHQRQPKVESDLSVILVDPTVKAFLVAEGITSSSDLFRGPAEEIGRAFIDWRRQQNLAEITASDAKQYVYAWRRCVVNHVPEEANANGNGNAPFISNRADTRLLSSSSGNFVGSPSEAVSCDVAIRRVATAVSSTPNALNPRESFVASSHFAVRSPAPYDLDSENHDRFCVEADRKGVVAPGQLAASTRNHMYQALNPLNPATHESSFLEGDPERFATSSQFAVRSPAPYDLNSEAHDRFSAECDRGPQADWEQVAAPGQFAGSTRNPMHRTSNTLNPATYKRSFAGGDQERKAASGRFVVRSPAPYALDWEGNERSTVHADRNRVVAPGQFVGSARNSMPPNTRNNFHLETNDRSVVKADRERVGPTGQFLAPPRNRMRPTPYALDWKDNERTIVHADRERAVVIGQVVGPPSNLMPPTRYNFDSEAYHRSIIQADREGEVATGQFIALPKNPMFSATYKRSPVNADPEHVVAPGEIVGQLRNPMPPAPCALELDTHNNNYIDEADQEQAVATGQCVAPPRNHVSPAPYALDLESHERSLVHADREQAVTGQFLAPPMPPLQYALDLATHEKSVVEADRERTVALGKFAASTRIPTIEVSLTPNASVSLTHGRSLVEADWERIVAVGLFSTSSTSKLKNAVPHPPNALDSATNERSTRNLNQTTASPSIDQSTAATRIPTAELRPALYTLDSVTQERCSTSTSSTATECAASLESAPTASSCKMTLLSTFNNGGTALVGSAEDNDMSASVSTLAADPLAVLGATALSFLSTQGIVTAAGFCRQSTEVLSQALSHWRQQRGMKSLLAGSVERYVQMWKQSVRRELAKTMPREHPAPADNASCQDNDHTEVDIETSEDGLEQRENVLPRDGGRGHVEQACASGQVAPLGNSPISSLDPGLCLLSSLAQSFLTSQCLTTTRLFTDWSTKEMAGALVDYRRQKNLKEWTLNTAERYVSRWKSEVQERELSQEEVPVEVDPSFEVFSPTVRSFLAAQSIANPSDFFLRSTQQLSEALVEWRRTRNLKILKLRTAEQYVQRWRRSVAGYQTLMTVTGLAPPMSGVETAPDTNFRQGRSALSPLRESENSVGRLFFGGAKGLRNISSLIDNGADGGCENADDGEPWATSSPHRMAKSERIHELEFDPALNILTVAAKAFLASRGITTAHSFLQSTNEALAHALVVYRRQQKLKEWTFSTAQRYIWNWKHHVKGQLSVDGGSAKTRPAGRPPLDCDWDATRGVFVPRFHRENHSKVARRPAVEWMRRSEVVDQSSFTSASRRKVTFRNDVRAERSEEDIAEQCYGRASGKLSDSKDIGERQLQRNSGKMGRNVTERTLLAQRTDTITVATANTRLDTDRDDSITVDTDLYNGADQSRGKDVDAYPLGSSGKRSRSESTPNAFERSPKRGWKVVASSLTPSPKNQIAAVYEA
jgi:hypothetical protein